MKNNRVCIDLDSVLSKFGKRTLEVFNEKYNTSYITDDIKSWDMSEWLNCEIEELYELWTPEFFLSVEPRDYAQQAFKDLRDMGFDPFVVTAYNASACVAKTQWLEKYLGLSEMDIIFCNNKYRVDADFRLDDRIRNFFDENAEEIRDCEHIVFHQEYNKDGSEGKYELNNYHRVENLKDFVEIMRNFKE